MTKNKIVHDLVMLTLNKHYTEAHGQEMPIEQLATEAFDLYVAAFNAIVKNKEKALHDLNEEYQSF